MAQRVTSGTMQAGPEQPQRTILIGITGAVGAAVMPHFVLYLRTRRVGRVQVIMTQAACRFVTPYAMHIYSGNEVYADTFATADGVRVPHIQLTAAADIFLVMPATANILAKAASGMCDDLVSSALVAARCPVLFAPSMNEAMWLNPFVSRNVGTLREHGHTVLEPCRGLEIADLQPTYGCLPQLDRVADEVERLLAGADSAPRRVS